jgi:2-polyprenyl-6-methoxyphenol hydroxylase-like FAD-dependent oxidoreductase
MIRSRISSTAVFLAITVTLALLAEHASAALKIHNLRNRLVVSGAGPVGLTLALKAKARGLDPIILEKRPAIESEIESGRGFSITLSEDAIRLLPDGAREKIREAAHRLLGRAIHSPKGGVSYNRVTSKHKILHSISRSRLTRILHESAKSAGIEVHSGVELIEADLKSGQFKFKVAGPSGTGPELIDAPVDTLIGTDGSGSILRPAIARARGKRESSTESPYVFYTFRIPPREDGSAAFALEWFHFWARKSSIAYGLPDSDGNLSGILAIEKHVLPKSEEGFRQLMASQFPDLFEAVPRLPELLARTEPRKIRTATAQAWSYEDAYAILGDAAHPMSFFEGLGTETGLEDVHAVDQRLAALPSGRWREAFREIEKERKHAAQMNQAASETPWDANLIAAEHRSADFRGRADQELSDRIPERYVPKARLFSGAGNDLSALDQRALRQDEFVSRLGKHWNWDASRIDWAQAAKDARDWLGPL